MHMIHATRRLTYLLVEVRSRTFTFAFAVRSSVHSWLLYTQIRGGLVTSPIANCTLLSGTSLQQSMSKVIQKGDHSDNLLLKPNKSLISLPLFSLSIFSRASSMPPSNTTTSHSPSLSLSESGPSCFAGVQVMIGTERVGEPSLLVGEE